MHTPKNLSDLIDSLPDGSFKESVMNYNFNEDKINPVYKEMIDDEFGDYLETGNSESLEKILKFALKKIGINMKHTETIDGTRKHISNTLELIGDNKRVIQDVSGSKINFNYNSEKTKNITKTGKINISGANEEKSIDIMDDGKVNIGGANNTLTIKLLNGTLKGNMGGANNTIIIEKMGPKAKIKVNKGGINNEVKSEGNTVKNTSQKKKGINITLGSRNKEASGRNMDFNGMKIDMDKDINGELAGTKSLGSLGEVNTYEEKGNITVSFTVNGEESRIMIGKQGTIGFIEQNQLMQGAGNNSANYYIMDKPLSIKSSYLDFSLSYEGKTIDINRGTGEIN